LETTKLLDSVGWQILAALQNNARISFAELGRAVGMSAPAVAERVRRMEDVGILAGYRAKVAPEVVGLNVAAFIRLRTPNRQYGDLTQLLQTMPEVLECYHLAGPDAFIIKVAAVSTVHLERVIDQLSRFGPTETSIVLSSPFDPKPISAAAADFDPG
jgi:Lrp/AsnC family leucine-responsive transcriptional regulator